ncbi:MAG: hypothetical protein HC773_11400 [Scytonema sp. CRU_2_7]|nr:hypothetical protein [Scytonema sp. CRU_2_7]
MKPRRSNASTNTDIFLDYWITKSELAEVLGVARSTLVIWENIAFWRIEAFRQAYPTKADGSSDRESPLSPYQAWVLGRIGRTMQRLQRQTRVKDYIQRNPYNSLGNYLSPATVQHGVTIPQFDVNSAMGTNLYSSESTIPETSIQDATRHRRVVARQSNSLDVALDVTARNRKALKLATEIRHLEGDAVDYHTAGIQTATKAVRNQIADRDYQIEDSKLEQRMHCLNSNELRPLVLKP